MYFHNFIRFNQAERDMFDEVDADVDEDDVPEAPASTSDRALNAWRDGIAEAMWRDYEMVTVVFLTRRVLKPTEDDKLKLEILIL
jgi:hypothetical protein